MTWLNEAQYAVEAVVTGVVVGDAIDEAVNDEDGSPFNKTGGEDAIKVFDENGGEWLDSMTHRWMWLRELRLMKR
jgi:hypothetical protein